MGILKRLNDWLNSMHDVAPTIEQLEEQGFKKIEMRPVYLAREDVVNFSFKDPITGAHTGTLAVVGVGKGEFIALVKPKAEPDIEHSYRK